VPMGKHLLVREADEVEPVTCSATSQGPARYSADLGVDGASQLFVNEIQEVYRLQGVRINDKHTA